MLYRVLLLVSACVSGLGCGHPIRDLANAAKDLVPDDGKSEPSCPAQASTRIALIANLHAGTAAAEVWDAARPEATSSFVISGSPHTADGQVVDVRFFFVPGAAQRWDWHVLSNRAGVAKLELGAGHLSFDKQGALLAADVTTPLRLPLADGSLSAIVELAFGTLKGPDADGFDGVTSSSEPSRLESYEQDGRAASDDDCD